jgi:hypothetical protein
LPSLPWRLVSQLCCWVIAHELPTALQMYGLQGIYLALWQ